MHHRRHEPDASGARAWPTGPRSAAAVTRRNRVRPDGELVAVPDRGLFWGNRGPLLGRDGELARYSSGRRWLICVLEFKGRRRVQWTPGRLTELYFLDEATGLAAGHRPCAECRRLPTASSLRPGSARYPDEPATVPVIDARLHADRLVAPGQKRTYVDRLGALPDATMVEMDGRPWLVLGRRLLAWTPGGYAESRPRAEAGDRGKVTVLTPRATVATLRAGYRPELHSSAQ